MTKQIINIGSTPNDRSGDSLRTAFQKVNTNFSELYVALGLDAGGLNLGAFEFTGSTISTTDSSSITIDQSTTISSNLTVGGDILPNIANGGDLGSVQRPWRSLYVSENTVYFGDKALTINQAGGIEVDGIVVATQDGVQVNADWNATSGVAQILNKPSIPADINDLTDTTNLLGSSAGPVQPYLEVTNTPFITQSVTLGTPVTITAAPQGVGAEVVITITEGSVLDSITIFEPGTGYTVGQNYIIWSYQIGGPMPGDSLTFTIDTVDENGGILTVTNVQFLGIPQNVEGVYVTTLNYQPSVFDTIDTGLTLTRNLNQGIYNSEAELDYDNNTYLSPLGTEWNSDGWGDLSGLSNRTYTTWRSALNNAVGNNIVASELVMHDTINDKYYKFDFTAWGGNNGSYAYTRTLVTDPNYFRKTNGGNEVDIIVEHPDLSLLEETYLEAEAMFGDFRDQDAQMIAPETRPWDGMPSYQAYELIITYEVPDGVLPPSSALVVMANSTQSNYLTWREALAVSVGITRDNNNGIYNPYTEEGWNEDNSPLGTGWNIDGWDDLTDIESRTYTNFYAAYGFGGLGNKVPGSRAVMYVPQTEKYYAIQWLSWTQNNQGGGFSYTRKEIDLTKLNEGVKFPDGTVLKSAEGLGRVKSTAVGNRRIEEAAGYNQVSVTAITPGVTQNAVIRQSSNNWDFYVNATPELTQLYDAQNTFNYLEFSFDAGNTWIKVGFGGGQPGVYYQMVFEDNINRPVTENDAVLYRAVTGGTPVVWWRSADLLGGSGNFRGAVIDYHAYTGDGTIIGTIHIVDDDGEENITHTEVSSGGTDLENDDLWLVQNEGTISYRRIDGENATLKIHWTAKVFYGSEIYD